MPSFADLKAKATSVANSGVDKARTMKERNTSVPMKKTNWDPYSGQPAPPPPPPRSIVNQRTKPGEQPGFLPPPSRTASNASSGRGTPSGDSSPGPAPPLPSRAPSSAPPALPQRSSPLGAAPPPPSRTGVAVARNATVSRPAAAGPPPPIARSTRPDLAALEPSTTDTKKDAEAIDWTNLSQEDKEVFFSWLDEFFSKHLNITINPPRTSSHWASDARGNASNTFGAAAPPFLNASSKPTSWGRQATTAGHDPIVNATDFITSYPPGALGASAAADLGTFFHPSTRWNTPWFNTTSGVPPPLEGSKDIRYVSSWQSRGSVKTSQMGVLFSDLSVFWSSVTFSMTNPESERDTKRKASYLPRPDALDRAALVEAHETYGETIAQFAESFLGTGTYCGRGECWDLANEALLYLAQYDYVPKPVPSISRTHGHLIYEGKAAGKGKGTVGRWRGGDDRIRRGDIVEWRKTRIGERGGFSMLGDPDHTAVIVSDSGPPPQRVAAPVYCPRRNWERLRSSNRALDSPRRERTITSRALRKAKSGFTVQSVSKSTLESPTWLPLPPMHIHAYYRFE
ncbi:hypothetical protein DFP72DRAFT_1173436 [Ephemerocybe angulata]|uniref:BBC1/AIM3 cysteine proteinase-fold domain-containing protein n=1 Tax=Ephemerocybe angulata TaxID=980116 RepID=A0A8H6HPQ1_9AGAR|nr:hypothetical protein DFP72DRAFT_1173436 [Tulosesus angulatus]